MEKFYIEGKEFVPEVNFDPEKDLLELSGDSYHEYTYEFFDPIFKWIEEYLSKDGRNVMLNFRMTYFNTASSKCFFDIIEMMQAYHESSKGVVTINWYYQRHDEDMLETGEDYIQDSGWEINLIPY
jgi:hypothetical protein